MDFLTLLLFIEIEEEVKNPPPINEITQEEHTEENEFLLRDS